MVRHLFLTQVSLTDAEAGSVNGIPCRIQNDATP